MEGFKKEGKGLSTLADSDRTRENNLKLKYESV